MFGGERLYHPNKTSYVVYPDFTWKYGSVDNTAYQVLGSNHKHCVKCPAMNDAVCWTCLYYGYTSQAADTVKGADEKLEIDPSIF